HAPGAGGRRGTWWRSRAAAARQSSDAELHHGRGRSPERRSVHAEQTEWDRREHRQRRTSADLLASGGLVILTRSASPKNVVAKIHTLRAAARMAYWRLDIRSFRHFRSPLSGFRFQQPISGELPLELIDNRLYDALDGQRWVPLALPVPDSELRRRRMLTVLGSPRRCCDGIT